MTGPKRHSSVTPLPVRENARVIWCCSPFNLILIHMDDPKDCAYRSNRAGRCTEEAVI